MRLILTRHGETKDNAKKIIQGHNPGELSELGILQAEKVAERLKDEKIDYIFASDLARATDTAKIIAKFHEGIPFELTEELRERHMGDHQGYPVPEGWSTKKYDLELAKKVKAEGWDKLHERAKLFLEERLPKFKEETVLIVAHNQINQAIILNLLNQSWEKVKEMKKMGNTSITEFQFDENNIPSRKIFDCIKHLKN